MQNGFCESFNGGMRDELLNETLFFGLDHARQVIGSWADDYNTARPHSSLGYQIPAAYAATLTATGARLRNADQLRRSPVAHTAPQGVSTAKALTAAGRKISGRSIDHRRLMNCNGMGLIGDERLESESQPIPMINLNYQVSNGASFGNRGSIIMYGSNAKKVGRLLVNLAANPGDISRYIRCIRKTPMSLEMPWLSFSAIDFLDRWLKPNLTVCEYGGGGSTFYFARRVQAVRTIESSRLWADELQRRCREKHLLNVDIQLEEIGADDYKNSSFVGAIEGLTPNVILVDAFDEWPSARLRPACFYRAEESVTTGGIIVVDDSWMYPGLRDHNRASRIETFRGVGPCRPGVTSTDVYFY